MTEDRQFALVGASMIATYAALLLSSRRYREDSWDMLTLEKSSIRVVVEHPIKTIAHLLSFALPILFMGLPS